MAAQLQYLAWCQAVLGLGSHFPGLSGFTVRQLDQYMWLLGRQLGPQLEA